MASGCKGLNDAAGRLTLHRLNRNTLRCYRQSCRGKRNEQPKKVQRSGDFDEASIHALCAMAAQKQRHYHQQIRSAIDRQQRNGLLLVDDGTVFESSVFSLSCHSTDLAHLSRSSARVSPRGFLLNVKCHVRRYIASVIDAPHTCTHIHTHAYTHARSHARTLAHKGAHKHTCQTARTVAQSIFPDSTHIKTRVSANVSSHV